MTVENKVAATTGEWAESYWPIVVAVDGSERNLSAVDWAAHEAAESGCEVVLLTAIEDHVVAVPHFSVRGQDQLTQDMLGDVRDTVRHVVSEQRVRTEVVAGSAVEVLLDSTEHARLLVVGKRGLGTFARMIVGSTSIAVAGRSTVPVAIVPDSWRQAEHVTSPVVLGIDPYKVDDLPVHLAFGRARRLGVPLVAVHGWESPTVYSWDPGTLAGTTSQWEQEAEAEFEEVLDRWRERFPDVELKPVHRRMHPATAILEASEGAQLVVLGRHGDSRFGGFAFGSVARAVLHYSECPVLVVPAPGASGHSSDAATPRR